jgi:ATP-dependent DNA helicase RecG
VKDFLMNFPRTHEDRSNIKPIQALDANGEIESVKAFVVEKKLIPTKSPKKLYEIRIQDEEGSQAVISLFNNPWAFKSYEVGQWYIITGKVVFEYRKIIFRHPDATKTSPPDLDEETETLAIEKSAPTPIQLLEQELYRITKNNNNTIDEHNLLYLAFLKKELSDRWYESTDHTDRAVVVIPAQAEISQNNEDPRIREDDNTSWILLAPKADGLSITDAYIKLKEYCQQHRFSGGILYYSDDHQRIKLLSYSSFWTEWNKVKNPGQQKNNWVYNWLDTSLRSVWQRNIDRIYPIYSKILGISPSWIARNMRKAIWVIPEYFKEYLPDEFLKEFGLLDVQTTIRNIHFPDSEDLLQMAQQRVYFDRLLRIQLHALLARQEYQHTSIGEHDHGTPDFDIIKEFIASLPFELTTAQKKVIKENIESLHSGKPMMRLLQWDVGSGKTIVAAIIGYYIIKKFNKQIVFLAPLSILAKQHYLSMAKLFLPLGIRVDLLEGSRTAKEKSHMKEEIKNGNIQIIVGTQAILQDNVGFHDLWLVVIDEQHKFWVRQRAFFHDHGTPHIIQMSATPIPRSLALAFFGEFDVSVIDELPAGRKAITTKIIDHKEWIKIAPWLRQKINEWQKIFVVAPLIEESETMELANVTEVFQATRELLPDYDGQIGLLHGRMKPKEKDQIMADFKSGKYTVLVATTVIEVGVDIPEATVMIIYNAERFWLSQLHQLRGRIGRNSLNSYCFLETKSKTWDTYKRLQAMEDTQDGFKLAQIDLQYRGAGEILGTRQSGQTDLPMEILTDLKFIEKVKSWAERLLDHHPKLDWLPGLKKFVEEQIHHLLA